MKKILDSHVLDHVVCPSGFNGCVHTIMKSCFNFTDDFNGQQSHNLAKFKCSLCSVVSNGACDAFNEKHEHFVLNVY